MINEKKESIQDIDSKKENKLLSSFKNFFNFIKIKSEWKKYILGWALFSILINIIIMFLNPVSSGNNILIYMPKLALNSITFMSIGAFFFLFRFRNIYMAIYSIIWVGLALANSILMEIRSTPLTKYDFTMLSEGMDLGKSFMTETHFLKIKIFIIFALFILILGIITSIKSKKYKFKNIMVSWIYIFLANNIASGLVFIFDEPLKSNYSEYGFVYAFTENILTPELKKPFTYKKSTMVNLKNQIDDSYSIDSSTEKPNIIAIQLESFFDPKTVEGLNLSENPIPYFDELKEKYSSGLLTVPTVGGGTARSEFEFITGMSLKNMIAGLVPHNTLLKKAPYFSSVYALKNQGYKTHLLHNFSGYFYNRDVVYNNLGFDTFTSLEFLNKGSLDAGLIKASRDNVFPTELEKILKSTESKDFIFGITAQLHGNYDNDYNEFENGIKATGGFKKEIENQVNDYVNELKSIDNIIKDIVETVEKLDEPTIIIFYSDHLPPLNYKGTNITEKLKYEVPYVVWDNMGLEREVENLSSFELLSKFMHKTGVEGNYLNKLQVTLNNDKKYEKYQDLLQYDIAFGDNYINEKAMPYKVETKLGLEDLRIDEISKEDITYTIKGNGFTPMTVLVVDEQECGITCEDENTIKFTTNLDLTGKEVYLKIRIGRNENSVVKSNIYKVK